MKVGESITFSTSRICSVLKPDARIGVIVYLCVGSCFCHTINVPFVTAVHVVSSLCTPYTVCWSLVHLLVCVCVCVCACVCAVGHREGAVRPAGAAPRVGGARRNRNMRAQAEFARRLQTQTGVPDYLAESEEGGERRGEEGNMVE